MNQAKGHEWDYVLVLHAVEGSWPLFHARTKAALDEELHALYVAVTRAEKGSFYSRAATRTLGPAKPSTHPVPSWSTVPCVIASSSSLPRI